MVSCTFRSGYGSSTREISATRSYPNLANQDTSNIPKTIQDNGAYRTFKLTRMLEPEPGAPFQRPLSPPPIEAGEDVYKRQDLYARLDLSSKEDQKLLRELDEEAPQF